MGDRQRVLPHLNYITRIKCQIMGFMKYCQGTMKVNLCFTPINIIRALHLKCEHKIDNCIGGTEHKNKGGKDSSLAIFISRNFYD